MKTALSIAAVICASVILMNTDFTEEVVYDCRLAEFHPDFPPEVREECRKLRYEHWKREQDEKENGTGVHENRRSVLRT